MMPVSFSRMSTFEQCETKYEHLYILKDVRDAGSFHTEYGTRIHEALEHYGRDGRPLSQEAVRYQPVVDLLLNKPGVRYFEHQMAIDVDHQPVDWNSPFAWFRGIADVLILNDSKAVIVDWKTGKVKDNPTQMILFALLVMDHFPEIEEVSTAFVWLAHNEVTSSTYCRKRKDQMWASVSPRIDALQKTLDLGVFGKTKSGLCGWCPVESCEHWRKRRE